ncbi:MAG: response regulator transcription factor [Aeromicrobium sp.]|uniref:winged helix-turn-helix domain-containing protein n=1 Tax=Aeromicrobium sp. TaxID=1871063 RepID=UPI0039E6D20C
MSPRRSRRDRVLVVDADVALTEHLGSVFGAAGLSTLACHRGDLAPAAVEAYRPDLVLLEMTLPGLGGLSVCGRVRAASSVPVVFVTERSATEDVVAGLDAGADDYVVKPVPDAELLARVRARLRGPHQPAEPLRCGDLVVDPAAHTVSRGDRSLDLTPLEFDLLACLLSEPDRVFTREELLRRVWGYHHAGDTKLVNVHVTRLRSKIEDDADDPRVIRTVRGVGYQAIPSPEAVDRPLA